MVGIPVELCYVGNKLKFKLIDLKVTGGMMNMLETHLIILCFIRAEALLVLRFKSPRARERGTISEWTSILWQPVLYMY